MMYILLTILIILFIFIFFATLVISGIVYLWRRFVNPGKKSASKTNTQKQQETPESTVKAKRFDKSKAEDIEFEEIKE